MKIEATVKIGGAEARFSFRPAGPGMYHAELVEFTGKPQLAPPKKILLVRNVREWSGSIENQTLLATLGKVIDEMASKAPIFNEGTERKRSNQNNTSPEQ